MPLTTSAKRPSWRDDIPALEFKMLNGRTSVPVFVTPLAIDAVAGAELLDVHERMERFPELRERIEKIASSKFDTDAIEDDGSVRVGQSDV